MPEIIFDACVLSNFALSGSFPLIKSLYSGTSYLTDFVAEEILRGIRKGHEALAVVRQACRDGWLGEINLERAEEKDLFTSLSVSLGSGEASSIAVAKIRGMVFACDDRVARREVHLLEVKLTGTVGILFRAVKTNLISSGEADNILQLMIARGFYSPVRSIGEITN